MDTQTRMARFESMRRAPGLRRSTSNKKLYVVHKDLQKQCQQSIKRHEFDARVVTAEVQRQQIALERKQQKIQTQQKTFKVRREQTHMLLERQENSHVASQDRFVRVDESKVKPQYMDIVKAIGHMSMPRAMKDRLRWECTVNNIMD